MNIKALTIADLKGDIPKIVGGGNIKLGDNPLFGSWSTMKGGDDEIRYVKKYGGSCSGPSPAQVLAFAPGKEQAAGVWET